MPKNYTMTAKSDRDFGGIQRIYAFDNGYEASVICNPYSHGGPEGLWECMITYNDTTYVLSDDDESGAIALEDVRGYLDDADLMDLIRRIGALPPR